MDSDSKKYLNIINENRATLRDKYFVKEIGIFGSVARGEQTATSDAMATTCRHLVHSGVRTVAPFIVDYKPRGLRWTTPTIYPISATDFRQKG